MDAISYEKPKLYIGSFITGLCAFAFIICGIFSFAGSLSKPNSDTLDKQTPSYIWILLFIIGISFSIGSWRLHSDATQNILPNIDSSSTSDGYFAEGE
jgi:uncharacterized membrane protein AbrB (regulator of aidB expression)